MLVGGWRREPCAHAPGSKPTRQQGTGSLLVGGFTLGSTPPCQQGTESLLAGGFTVGSVRARLPTPPTSREPTPARGVALVHGGQRPITPQS